MRLIDADALKRAICYNMPTRTEVNIIIDAMPDAIVRCRDCKSRFECDYWLENGDDWFCADGETEVNDGN